MDICDWLCSYEFEDLQECALGDTGDTVYAIEVHWKHALKMFFVRASNEGTAKQKLRAHINRLVESHFGIGLSPFEVLVSALGWKYEKEITIGWNSKKESKRYRACIEDESAWTGSWVSFYVRNARRGWVPQSLHGGLDEAPVDAMTEVAS